MDEGKYYVEQMFTNWKASTYIYYPFFLILFVKKFLMNIAERKTKPQLQKETCWCGKAFAHRALNLERGITTMKQPWTTFLNESQQFSVASLMSGTSSMEETASTWRQTSLFFSSWGLLILERAAAIQVAHVAIGRQHSGISSCT